MAGVQPDHAGHMDCSCCTTGGNRTLINADEGAMDPWTTTAGRTSPLGEDDSHVVGIYREVNFGGS